MRLISQHSILLVSARTLLEFPPEYEEAFAVETFKGKIKAVRVDKSFLVIRIKIVFF